MDNEQRKWIELIIQGQRDLDDMTKQKKKPSDALLDAAKREMDLAAEKLGITLKEFASIWKTDLTVEQFEKAANKLKAAKSVNQPLP